MAAGESVFDAVRPHHLAGILKGWQAGRVTTASALERLRQKKLDAMLGGLKNGDRVVTGGGIVGTIVTLGEDDNTVTVRVKPDNVKLQFSRSAVTGLIEEEEEK